MEQLVNEVEVVHDDRQERLTRTAYAKGFPLDWKYPDVEKYFRNSFENVEDITMRNYYDYKVGLRKFKGSVFVTFKTQEQAIDFVLKPDVKCGEKFLLRYMQERYIELKRSENEKRNERKKARQSLAETKQTNGEKPLPRGAVVHFVGAEGNISREDIKFSIKKVESILIVAFVNFNKGDKEGDIRFNNENDGKKFLEKLEEGKVSWHWKVEFIFCSISFFVAESQRSRADVHSRRRRERGRVPAEGSRRHEEA